jgi:ATP-dependent helicase HrpB
MSGRMAQSDLPIYELEDALAGALRAGSRVILQAPTGSGKSTQVPQILLRLGLLGDRGEVVVLQPRRLATRLLAKRVAEEVGSPLGGTVGYQIRLESRVGEQTRIRFVTEGILIRQMAFDPGLKGVKAVIFDEFHERHLHGDIGLARALQIQKSHRPDLAIIVMSATLDAAALRDYLDPCVVLTSRGRMFPVGVEYLPKPANFEIDPPWDVAARACEAAAERTGGDILVFMPGAYEIARTVQALQASRALRGFAVLPLHGELPPEAQDRAVARAAGRKVIVSTNVAETSLTIDGLTAVVDSGLARIARFDPHRGINTLLVEKISVASADQRAGRAGRTAPGICLRLWTEREHGQRAPQDLPEVRRLDLSEVVLALAAAGVPDLDTFPWLEKPDARALLRARSLLADLGALSVGADGAMSITDTGRRMLRFPVHPRYARMFLAAQEKGCVRPVALMAALTQGRGLLLRGVPREVEKAREDLLGGEDQSDFFLLMRAWTYADRNGYSLDACRRLGIHAQSARQVGPLFEQFLEIAGKGGAGGERVDGDEVRKCILAGFSDQLARRLDTGTLRCELVHGRRGLLARESAVQKARLFVVSEITEVGGRGGEVNVLLGLATAVEESWLREMFPGDLVDSRTVAFDPEARRVVARRERRFRDLVLESRAGEDPPEGEAAALLAAEVLSGRLRIEAWDLGVEQWITRVNRLAEWFPEFEVNPIDEKARALLVEQVCYGETGARGVREKDPMPALREWLTAEQLAALDEILPERLEMANGRKSRITYPREGPPVLSARIQELYGVEGRLSLGRGRVPLRIEVLGPNQRPLQVTEDLGRFWRETYPSLKPELQRRYPRHEWR